MSASKLNPAVARIWEGWTRAAIADTYAAYLFEEGVKKIPATKGNLGVQVLRRVRDDVAALINISYWGSRDEDGSNAGADIEKTHRLPKDAEHLLELLLHVKHFGRAL